MIEFARFVYQTSLIERTRLDAALFAPPADYRKMEMRAGMPAAPRRRPWSARA